MIGGKSGAIEGYFLSVVNFEYTLNAVFDGINIKRGVISILASIQ
jgi:hypothetical protein